MKGFEININEEEPVFVSSDSIVSAALYVDDANDDTIYVSGADAKHQRFLWVSKNLDLGDKIKIKVTEIDKITPPLRSYPEDRTELLKIYLQLKKELKAKGII